MFITNVNSRNTEWKVYNYHNSNNNYYYYNNDIIINMIALVVVNNFPYSNVSIGPQSRRTISCPTSKYVRLRLNDSIVFGLIKT